MALLNSDIMLSSHAHTDTTIDVQEDRKHDSTINIEGLNYISPIRENAINTILADTGLELTQLNPDNISLRSVESTTPENQDIGLTLGWISFAVYSTCVFNTIVSNYKAKTVLRSLNMHSVADDYSFQYCGNFIDRLNSIPGSIIVSSSLLIMLGKSGFFRINKEEQIRNALRANDIDIHHPLNDRIFDRVKSICQTSLFDNPSVRLSTIFPRGLFTFGIYITDSLPTSMLKNLVKIVPVCCYMPIEIREIPYKLSVQLERQFIDRMTDIVYRHQANERITSAEKRQLVQIYHILVEQNHQREEELYNVFHEILGRDMNMLVWNTKNKIRRIRLICTSAALIDFALMLSMIVYRSYTLSVETCENPTSDRCTNNISNCHASLPYIMLLSSGSIFQFTLGNAFFIAANIMNSAFVRPVIQSWVYHEQEKIARELGIDRTVTKETIKRKNIIKKIKAISITQNIIAPFCFIALIAYENPVSQTIFSCILTALDIIKESIVSKLQRQL